MAKNLTIKFFPDRRTTIVPKPEGGVRGPTYGIKIRSSIRQLCRAADIRMICLQQRDFYNILWTQRGILGVPHSEFWRRCWLGFSSLDGYDSCYLNATALKKETQAEVDFVCLHEISHILLQIVNEKETDRGAILMAEHLGLKVPARINEKDEIEFLSNTGEWYVSQEKPPPRDLSVHAFLHDNKKKEK